MGCCCTGDYTQGIRAKCLRLTDAYFAPVLILQQSPWSSFQGEEAGARQSVWREEEADVKTQFCVNGKSAWACSLADLLALVVCYASAISAKPALCHVDLSCCSPQFEQCACLCKHLGSGFPVLLTGRQDRPPYTGNAGVNAVMFLRFLSLCVHNMVSSARTNKCVSKCWDSIGCMGIPLPSEMRESLHGGSHMLHVHLGGRRGLHVGVSSWPKSCSRNPQRYLCGFPFSCLLSFFFFWLSRSSLLIYCMRSRDLGKGGSQTVLLPKGKEAGRRSYFSSRVM